MSVARNRESARTTDPATLNNLAARIRQNLDHNRRARYERIVRPVNDGEAFAQTEAELERDRFRNS